VWGTYILGKEIKIGYNEQIRYLRSNNTGLVYVKHILNDCHEYGCVDEIMKLANPFTERM